MYLIINFTSVCLYVIKNPEFPEMQTVIILVALIQNRPKFETFDTVAGVNQSIPSLLSVSPTPLRCFRQVSKCFFCRYTVDLINQPFSSPMEEEQNIPNCQTGEKIMLPAGNMKISREQNIELISPQGQLKRDTDSVIAEDWKLGKIACCGWVAI